ncbi:hypothetical protein DFH28DRAFT_1199766 [Melampsora americana]|nr:hypothetical protein DFH28DRAFT_1199766 [Melampsora americana]
MPPLTASNTPYAEEFFLPAPPEIEITTPDGKRDAMDAYVQDFGSHQYGYNIRRGNSTTGLICHYHCHRGGFPPTATKANSRPSRSARIGCNFKLTARPNHAKKSWILIHTHLGHNHPADYTVKPRKRQQKTTPVDHVNDNPINTTTVDHATTNPIITIPAILPPPSNPGYSHTNPNTPLKTILSDVSARLEAMTPTTRQQKLQQIKSIVNEESTIITSINSNFHHTYKPTDQDSTLQDEVSIDQMLQDMLVPFHENDSPDTTFQVEKDLIPFHPEASIFHNSTSNTKAYLTTADHKTDPPETKVLDQLIEGNEIPARTVEQSDNKANPPETKVSDHSIEGNRLPARNVKKPAPTLETTSPITQRITRNKSRKCALTMTPAITNPALPALLTKYQIPLWLATYVRDIHEVKADGHCGFRAISVAIGQPQDEWLLSRLRTSKPNVLTEQEYWLSMPGFGGVIATAFDRPVIYYGPDSNHLIMFPYASPPNENPPIVLALCNYHYCSLTLDYTLPNLPVPRLCRIWRRSASLVASTWVDKWQHLIDMHAKQQEVTRQSKRRKQVTINVES